MNIVELTKMLKVDTMPKRCSIAMYSRLAVYQATSDSWLKVGDISLASGISRPSARVALDDLLQGEFVEMSTMKTGESLDGKFRNRDILLFRRKNHG